MKQALKLFRYIKDFKAQVGMFFLTTLLAVVFGLFSFTMLGPVLQVLFGTGTMGGVKPTTGKGINLVGNVTQWINDFVLRYDRLTALTYIVIIVVVFTILKNLFIYLSLNILNPIRYAILRRLRNDMFTKVLSLPIGFFTEERKADLISRMTNDINEIEVSIMNVLESFIREPLTIIFVLVSMVAISPQLTIFLVLFLPVAGFVIGRVGKSLKKPSNLAQEYLGSMLGVIDETIAGMRVVKAFNAERHQHLRFMELNNTLFRVRNKISRRKELGSPLSETMGIIVVCLILWYGGKLIFSGQSNLTGPFFLTYIGLFYMVINPVKNLSTALNNVQKGAAALDRIEHLLNADNNITERPDALPIESFERAIELKNVQFAYGDKKILNNINITVPKGKTIALVGASGAGKSTLVDLVPRFHDVTGGEILVDGVNVKDVKLYDLRKLIGVVSQDPILFNDTIYNNITLGTGGASQEQVEEAAHIAHAHSFISQKPEGYQTNVGDRGMKLSGGERQRVTIARAVLKNPPILILDEATSSLDTESERMVQDAINSLMKNRTCIVIAHRLSTVQHADEIIVLDKGNIAERGTHAQLISSNGLYKKLVDMQQVK
ncbi:MAG: antibiotic ABC transporter ATP-binding protein [Bacteroidetes bacterium 43-93]|nr:ABC transporter ATP-binding protein [Bacteroidota bacterium]OJW97604.1 MAG: antibiotic ABC transporter ATP-binding protein [Bacteroidetes bacterium 43-93]